MKHSPEAVHTPMETGGDSTIRFLGYINIGGRYVPAAFITHITVTVFTLSPLVIRATS